MTNFFNTYSCPNMDAEERKDAIRYAIGATREALQAYHRATGGIMPTTDHHDHDLGEKGSARSFVRLYAPVGELPAHAELFSPYFGRWFIRVTPDGKTTGKPRQLF